MFLFAEEIAAAGALIEAPSSALGFWGCVAQLSAPCWVERESSEANPAGAPYLEWGFVCETEGGRRVSSIPDGATAAPHLRGPRGIIGRLFREK